VAVQARIGNRISGLDHGILIPGLRCPVGDSSGLSEVLSELYPIRLIDWDGLAVLTPTSGREHEGRGIDQSHGGKIDKRPSLINIGKAFRQGRVSGRSPNNLLAPGSLVWTSKIIFELGKRIPRIT
jgi:hypothetical protein